MAVTSASANFFGIIAGAILRSDSGSFTSDTLDGPTIRRKMRELKMPPIAICQLGLEVGEVESTLRAASRKLGNSCTILDAMPMYTKRATIERIETAMQQVAQTAAQLDKVDLETDQGLETMFKALDQCERKFALAVELASERLKTISTIHAQIVEVQTKTVLPLKARLNEIKSNFVLGIKGSAAQYKIAQATSKTEKIALDNLHASINNLEEKIRDDQSAKQTTGVVFDIFTLGIYHAINGHAPDPLHLEDAIGSKRRELESAANSHRRSLDMQMVLTYQMGQIRRQSMDMLAACGEVPRILEQIEAVIETSSNAQKQLVGLKDDASALELRTKALKHNTRNTKDLSVLREEFVNGLTSICDAAKLDPKLDKVIGITLDTINPNKTIDTSKTLFVLAADQKEVKARRTIGPLGIPAISRQPIPSSHKHITDDFWIGALGVPVAPRRNAVL